MEPRLTKLASVGTVVAALVFVDGGQWAITVFDLIPVVGNFFSALASAAITLIGSLSFFLWFKIKGVEFSASTKKMLLQIATPLVEVVWPINKLPAFTLSVLAMVVIINLEDRALVKKNLLNSKVKKATGKKQISGVDGNEPQNSNKEGGAVAADFDPETEEESLQEAA